MIYERLCVHEPGIELERRTVAQHEQRRRCVVRCERVEKDGERVVTLHCTLDPGTRAGMEGADRKVKGTIHWVSAKHAVAAEVRLYDRLFTEPQPDAGGKDFLASLNPNSLRVVQAVLEPTLANAQPDNKFQFERHGYFVADRIDHAPGKPVFNLAVSLKDGWGK